MNNKSVELLPVILLPKANISLWDSPAVTSVRPVRLCHRIITYRMRAPISRQSKNVSPQNGGFIRAKLTRPRTFCYKNKVRNIQNGGFIRPKSGPLIRHQARILYLLILWPVPVPEWWNINRYIQRLTPGKHTRCYVFVVYGKSKSRECSS